MTAAEIAARLAQCRKDWLPSVFSAGRIERGVFLLGNAEGSAGRSLPVPLNPSRRRLVDFASDWRGDDLALWATAKRLTPGEAYQDAKRWLGLWDEGTGSAVTIPRPAEQPPPLLVDPYDHADYERDHHNRELAQETWRQTERIRRSRDAMDYLVIRRGIEVGHIFQLGNKYSKAMKCEVLGENGKPVTLEMGCYGIEIGRAHV